MRSLWIASGRIVDGFSQSLQCRFAPDFGKDRYEWQKETQKLWSGEFAADFQQGCERLVSLFSPQISGESAQRSGTGMLVADRFRRRQRLGNLLARQ